MYSYEIRFERKITGAGDVKWSQDLGVLSRQVKPIFTEHADIATGVTTMPGGLSGILHALPDDLEQEPLLRVQDLRLRPIHGEKRGIKTLEIHILEEVSMIRGDCPFDLS